MRTKNSTRNLVVSIASNSIAIILGLITQKIFVNKMGLALLGLNGLFNNIISMLSVAELGLGVAVVYHLYKPFAVNDKKMIVSLLRFYQKCYQIIAFIILAMAIVFSPFLSTLVGKDLSEGSVNIYIVFLLFVIDSVLSYILSYKRSILVADQKNYIIDLAHVAYLIILNVSQVTVLLATNNYYLFLILKIIMRVAENIVILKFVNIKYSWINDSVYDNLALDKEIKLDIFRKIRGLMYHKISSFFIFSTDSVVISYFLGISIVGLYANYSVIILAVTSLISQAFGAITSSVGDLITTTSNPIILFKTYQRIRFANFWLSALASIAFFVCIDVFIAIWFGSSYILERSVVALLSINLFIQLFRSSLGVFKEAAGIFYEDRFVPIFESLINVIFSILLVTQLGLSGVFIGTILSNLFLHFYGYPKYVYKKVFKKPTSGYYIDLLGYSLLFSGLILTSGFISNSLTSSYDSLSLIIRFCVSMVVVNGLIYAIFRNRPVFIYFYELARNTIKQNTESRL